MRPDPASEEYDRLAPIYDRRWRRYIDSTLRAVADVTAFAGDERVLDVACGTGELARSLLSRWPGLRITGVDLSAGMLAEARAKDIGRRVDWVRANADSLPLPDAAFDHVTCANSFHYFARPDLALAEMRRVLRPSGRLILVDWCDDYLACKICSVWLRFRDPAFKRTYSLRACEDRLRSAGFRIVDAHRFRVGWIWGLMRLAAERES